MDREEAVRLIKQMIFKNYSFKLDDEDKDALIEAVKALEMPEYYGSMRPRVTRYLPYSKKEFKFCPHCGGRLEANE